MKAWYFAPEGEKLEYGDGRAIAVGHMHTVKGKPELCEYGLHGSVRLIDALQYASSNILYRVDITRHLEHGDDKLCGQRRQYLARIDATKILRKFAWQQAMINIELVKPYASPEKYALIVEYLTTGKEELREAAYAAAYGAAGAAYWAAYWAANGAARAANGAAYEAAYWAANEAAYRAAKDASKAAYGAANEQLTGMVMEALKEQGYTE